MKKNQLNIPALLCILFIFSSCSKIYIGKSYIWKQGDSIKSISKKFQVSILELRKNNEVYDSEDLIVGARIFIPKQKRAINIRTENANIDLAWPSGGTISSGFGKRSNNRTHYGIDLTKDNGRSISASADGIVEFSGRMRGFGNTVIIKHNNVTKTLYAHNELIYVTKGQIVKRKQIISKMGTTGRSTGVHLHFEVHVQGKPQNPLRFLPIR